MKIEFVNATPCDYEGIHELAFQLLTLHAKNRPNDFTETDDVFPEDYFDELLQDPHVHLFVGKELSTCSIVAYSIIRALPPRYLPFLKSIPTWFIDDFCVHEDFQHHGIGKQLFTHITEAAKRQKIESIELNVWHFNEPAKQFYEAMGMKEKTHRLELHLNK